VLPSEHAVHCELSVEQAVQALVSLNFPAGHTQFLPEGDPKLQAVQVFAPEHAVHAESSVEQAAQLDPVS